MKIPKGIIKEELIGVTSKDIKLIEEIHKPKDTDIKVFGTIIGTGMALDNQIKFEPLYK